MRFIVQPYWMLQNSLKKYRNDVTISVRDREKISFHTTDVCWSRERLSQTYSGDQIWTSLIKPLKEESDTLFRNVYICDAPNTCWCDIKHALIWKAITHGLRETDTSNNQRRASTTLMFQSLTHKQYDQTNVFVHTLTITILVTKMC